VYLVGENVMSRMAVLVLDMLNDFVTGDLKTDRAAGIIKPIQSLVEAARAHGVPVIYSNDAHLR
jgi:nicotinamidase-related amidase